MSEVIPVVEVLEELPPSPERAGTRFWRLVIEQVRANHGAWCRVPGTFDPSTATHLRQGRNTQVDPEELDIETRYEAPDDGRKRISIFLRTKHG